MPNALPVGFSVASKKDRPIVSRNSLMIEKPALQHSQRSNRPYYPPFDPEVPISPACSIDRYLLDGGRGHLLHCRRRQRRRRGRRSQGSAARGRWRSRRRRWLRWGGGRGSGRGGRCCSRAGRGLCDAGRRSRGARFLCEDVCARVHDLRAARGRDGSRDPSGDGVARLAYRRASHLLDDGGLCVQVVDEALRGQAGTWGRARREDQGSKVCWLREAQFSARSLADTRRRLGDEEEVGEGGVSEVCRWPSQRDAGEFPSDVRCCRRGSLWG